MSNPIDITSGLVPKQNAPKVDLSAGLVPKQGQVTITPDAPPVTITPDPSGPTVPMIGPDGTSWDIPAERVQDAVKAGGREGVWMKGPDGWTGIIPRDQAPKAIHAGGKPFQSLQAMQQDATVDGMQQKEYAVPMLKSALLGLLSGASGLPETERPVLDALKGYVKTVSDPKNLIPIYGPIHMAIQTGRGIGQQFIDSWKEVAPVLGKLTPGGGFGTTITPDEAQEAAHGGGKLAGMAVQAALAKKAGNLDPVSQSPVLKAVTKPAEALSESMYQSALKPSASSFSGPDVKSMVKTGLENAVPVSEAGTQKLSGLISDLNGKVKAQIAVGQQAGSTISRTAVTNRLIPTLEKFSNQVNPESDVNSIAQAEKEFTSSQPERIPVQQAQDVKTGTYKQLSKKYGELSNATVESQKALARGIKEELEAQFPEIKDLNAKQSKLIGLDEALERAVRRTSNRSFLGLGDKLAASGAGAAIGAVTGSGELAGGGAVAAMVLHHILTDSMVQSKLAIALSQASKGATAALSAIPSQARVAAYAGLLNKAAGSQGLEWKPTPQPALQTAGSGSQAPPATGPKSLPLASLRRASEVNGQ